MATKKAPTNYETALAELREILQSLEEGHLALEALSGKMERAAFLISYCKEQLRETEEKIKGDA